MHLHEDKQSLEEQVQEHFDVLKRHPFSIGTLQEMARFLTGDETIKVKPSKGKKWKFIRSSNTIMLPAKHLKKDSIDRKDGLHILGVLLHEIGHHKYTDFDYIDKIYKRAESITIPPDGKSLPPKVFTFLHNCLEDPRINEMMMNENQASVAIGHVYDEDWSKRSASELPTSADENLLAGQKEKLQRARYKQFGYNIIYFWRHGDYMPETRPEVEEALNGCISDILKCIHGVGFERKNFPSSEAFNKAVEGQMNEILHSPPIWDTYVQLVKDDIEELGDIEDDEDDKEQPGIPDDDDIPHEDQDEYYPEDMESSEGDGKSPHIFKFHPAVAKSYLTTGVRSTYVPSNRRWTKIKEMNTYETPSGFNKESRMAGKITGLIALPLPKGWVIDLDSLTHTGGAISVHRDQYGVIYFRSLDLQEFEVDVGPDNDFLDQGIIRADNTEMYDTILSMPTEAMLEKAALEASNGDNFEAARIIQGYIQKNKKYTTKKQGKLYKTAASSNGYFKNIDDSDSFECYTANTFLCGLCRRIGVPSRLISGFHSTKVDRQDRAKKVFNSEGHAWSEIWDGDKWQRIDATPSTPADGEGDDKKPDNAHDVLNDDAENANKEMESNMDKGDEKDEKDMTDEDYTEEDKENEVKDLPIFNEDDLELQAKELKDVPREAIKFFDQAFEITKLDSDRIIEQLSKIDDEQKSEHIKRQLAQKKHRRKGGKSSGRSISRRTTDISTIVNGGTRIFERTYKPTPYEIPMQDKFNSEMAMSFDMSGSMGESLEELSLDFASLNKRTHAFLSCVMLLQVYAHYLIPCHISFFADNSTILPFDPSWYRTLSKGSGELNRPAVIKALMPYFQPSCYRTKGISGANKANKDAVNLPLRQMQSSEAERRLLMVFSDGDGDSNQFLTEESRLHFANDHNLYVIGYGLGQGAASPSHKTLYGRNLSVIQSQFHSDEYNHNSMGHRKTKGIPVKDYKKLTKVVGTELFSFLSSNQVVYNTSFDDNNNDSADIKDDE